MKSVWTRYHVYVFKGGMGSLDYPNYHPRTLTISKKISEDGTAMIHTAPNGLLNRDVFRTKTDHHEGVFKYRTSEACRRSIE
ncbi:TPA: hypothetical protein DCZ39_05755 [Patescibacteria group bacterium]|nr:hypothetical protein [Candidatus Gracilibacteria bacterium]